MEHDCFTILCWFLLYNKMNQLYISPHTGQNAHHQKIYTQYMRERKWRKGNLLALLIGMQFDKTSMENSMQVP